MVLMAGGAAGIKPDGFAVGLQGCGDVALLPLHQTEIGPRQGHLRGGFGGRLSQLDGFIQGTLIHQPSRQVDACPQAGAGIQRDGEGLPITLHGPCGIRGRQGHPEMEQQFVALSVRPCRPLEPAVQQRDGLGLLAFADQQSTELGTGVGIAGVGGQFALHGLSQPCGLVAAGQQFRAIAVMQDRRLRAIHHPPLGFTVQQCIDAVVDHGVIRPAPAEIGMAAEQTADPGVGRHGGTQFVAQQVDHQHVRLSHQLTQLGDDLRLQPFVGIQH